MAAARRDQRALGQDAHLGHLGHVGHQLPEGGTTGEVVPRGVRGPHGELEPLTFRSAVLTGVGAACAPQDFHGLDQAGGVDGGGVDGGGGHDMLLGHGGCVKRPIGS